MKKIKIQKLDPKRFNALAGHSRSPAAAYVSKELEWYRNEDESLLGVILLDIIDNDYVSIMMVPDEAGRYRCFKLKDSIPTLEDARTWIINTMKWYTGQGVKVCPQGDSSQGVNLFDPITPIDKQHPYFTHLANNITFLSARTIINNMMPHFVDIDGNFVEQFQTSGFEARLWELYMNTYLVEEELFIDRTEDKPDFVVEKYGKTVAIEAVIVGRKKNNPPKYFYSAPELRSPEEIGMSNQNEMPIRFGSPLYSKLQKKYWELPHVQGNPLVFAIADFHDDQSMLWSPTALINYLYGFKYDFHYDENKQLIITPVKIDTHKVGKKEIPSGYFLQPESEYVSAILFSASGTISKFNRIGRQAGYYDPRGIMIRQGTCHNHDPNASMPNFFRYIVDEQCNETWAEGLSMYHNPNARFPVPEELFPSIAHHRFIDGRLVSLLPDFHPYGSVTYHIIGTKSDT